MRRDIVSGVHLDVCTTTGTAGLARFEATLLTGFEATLIRFEATLVFFGRQPSSGQRPEPARGWNP